MKILISKTQGVPVKLHISSLIFKTKCSNSPTNQMMIIVLSFKHYRHGWWWTSLIVSAVITNQRRSLGHVCPVWIKFTGSPSRCNTSLWYYLAFCSASLREAAHCFTWPWLSSPFCLLRSRMTISRVRTAALQNIWHLTWWRSESWPFILQSSVSHHILL